MNKEAKKFIMLIISKLAKMAYNKMVAQRRYVIFLTCTNHGRARQTSRQTSHRYHPPEGSSSSLTLGAKTGQRH